MSDRPPEEPIAILLIEDNPGDVRLTQEAFSSIDLEVEFEVVTNGRKAVQYIQQHLTDEPAHSIDLILLDLNLPGIDGFEILDYLDDEIDAPPPPVLVLSSSEASNDIKQSYKKGSNAYLSKPDSMSEFEMMAESIKDFWFERVRHPLHG